jgi:hypothetical protein
MIITTLSTTLALACFKENFRKRQKKRETEPCMHQDLARSSPHLSLPSHPLTRRVPGPSRLPCPTCQPRGYTLAPTVDHAPDREPGRAPRSPPLLHVSPTKRTHAPAPLHLACSPGEATPSPVHHTRQATPNPLQTRRPGHAPVLYPTPTLGRFHSRTQALHLLSTLLAQTLTPSRPLDRRGHRRPPARADVTER